MRWKGRLAGVVVLALLAAFLTWAFWPVPAKVEMGTAARGPMTVTIDDDARTRVVDRFLVHAPVAGELVRPTLRAGDAVAEGDVVAVLAPRSAPLPDPREREAATAAISAARAALDGASAQVRSADALARQSEADVVRQRALASTGHVSRSELDAAEASARARGADRDSARFAEQVARFHLRQAEAALAPGSRGAGRVEIPSPVTARVLRVIEASEGPVEAGQHLLELGDPRRLEIVADLLTSDAVQVVPGARAILEGWGDEPLEGRVRRIEPSAVTRISALGVEEQRVDVLIDPVSPPERWSAVGDGFALDARIVTWESPDVLLCPASALFRSGTGWAAFVVEKGRARLRPVEVGHRAGFLAEILSGLAEGDRVVLHPSDAVSDGVRVRQRG